jgi:hypothetical protein
MVMVAPAARLVAYSAFDATLIRRAMTAAAVSAFVSKSGDIRESRRHSRGRGVNATTIR